MQPHEFQWNLYTYIHVCIFYFQSHLCLPVDALLFSFFIHNVFQVAYRPEGPGVKSMLITIDIPFKIMYTSL